MTVRTQVRGALQGLADDQVFPLVAPEGTLPPYVVFQIVGGDPQESLSGERAQKRLRRLQVRVWAKTSLEAEAIASQAEDALKARPDLQAEVLTEAIDDYDETTKYRGTRQDFYLFC